jgi:hypothetical protein
MSKTKGDTATSLANVHHDALLAHYRQSEDAVIRRLANDGFYPERVDPKSVTSVDPEMIRDAEQEVLDRLESDGYANANEAFLDLMRTFGVSRFADKKQLAADCTTFNITRIVQRVNGGYDGDDDWALEIITEDGEPQVLTLGMNPHGRDRFLWVLAYALSKKGGQVGPAQLDAYQMKNDKTFYALVPPQAVGQMRNVTDSVEPQTIEAEASVVS